MVWAEDWQIGESVNRAVNLATPQPVAPTLLIAGEGQQG